MEFIDILVRELPKRGGWPEGAVECVRFVDEATIDFYDEHGNWPDDCSLTYGPIAKAICITPTEPCQRESVKLEEYEAALATSKPEWDGDGIPPVGCECEGKQLAQLNWNKFKVVAIENGSVFGFWNDNVSTGLDSMLWEFRPIRSEADKKRDEAVEAMIKHKDDPIAVTESYYHAIYDAIASGKIPHIRID